MRGVHFSVKTLALFLFLALAAPGAALSAAAPDAGVSGLWFTMPAFPGEGKKAELVEFDDERETGTVTYIRSLDEGRLTLEIRRQEIADSRLQGPENVEELIEMRVHNDDVGADALKKNVEEIILDSDSRRGAEIIGRPCSMAAYPTGSGETARTNASIIFFIGEYSYEVLISIANDSISDYENLVEPWCKSITVAENSSAAGTAWDKYKGLTDKEIKGPWLEISGLPTGQAPKTDVAADGTITRTLTVDDSMRVIITRLPNPDGALSNEQATRIVARYAGLDEDKIELNSKELDEDFPLALAHKHPFAAAQYTIGEDAEEPVRNMAMLFFPDGYVFLLHVEMKRDALEKHGEALTNALPGMKLVEK